MRVILKFMHAMKIEGITQLILNTETDDISCTVY